MEKELSEENLKEKIKILEKETATLKESLISQKENEEKLRQSQEQLFQAQKMETLGTLVAGVAHEINNPINLIMYNIPLLKKIWHDFKPVIHKNATENPVQKYGGLSYEFLNENLDQLITDMDLAAKRVETIVSRLKDFSRKSSIIDKSEMSVNDAIQNTLRLAQSTLKKSNVDVRLDLSEEIPSIKGHLQSIEQVILNLVINAIEAIEHDHGAIDINTDYDEKKKQVILTVCDNGSGMPPEVLEKIFDPFFTQKQTKGGTGLGLSVTYSLVKAHEGEITCQSEEGTGTRFIVKLPLSPGEKPLKILIADDDQGLQKLLYQVLTKAGNYTIEKAFNGTEALIKMGTYLPDLLILDLFMPQMNGLDVCRTIIKEEKLSKMKVMIITGLPNSIELAEIKKIGFMNVYTKPFNISQFVKAVEEILASEGGF